MLGLNHIRTASTARRRQARASAIAAVALGCALSLGACGGSKHQSSTHQASSPSTSKTTSQTQAPARPIATETYNTLTSNTPQTMRVSIYDLRRQGPYVVLDFAFSCPVPAQAQAGCDTSFTLSPDTELTAADVGPSERVNGFTASGVNLVDPDAQQKYLPVRDSEDRPFASQLPQSVKDTRTYLAWVRYPAPPASVTNLDVVFPDGGPQIPHVPITSGPGPAGSASLVAPTAAPFAQTPESTDTTGLTLPVRNLVTTVGNPTGSDSESSNQATITLRSDVLFRFGKSSLTSHAKAVLQGVAARIKSRAKGTVPVTGYTDSIGSDAVNVPLSVARARSVVAVLRPATPGVAYTAVGKGSADPVAPNTKADGSDNPAGRALNRRVTIVFAVRARSAPQVPSSAKSISGAAAGSGTSISFRAGPELENKYTASVGALFREGNLVVLRLTVGCLSGQGGSCDTEGDLIGTLTVPPVLPSGNNIEVPSFFGISGFYLQDPGTGAEYVMVHDNTQTPLNGAVTDNVPVGQRYQYWGYFPAPPPSVSTVTLITPGTARRLSVPIASAAPAG